MKIIPDNRPQLSKVDAEKIIKSKLGANLPPLVILGIRGYFTKTMGDPTKNDYNLYDDAAVVFGLATYATFNFNTDPFRSVLHGKGLAVLDTGVYTFYKGKHKGKYNALRSYPEGVVLPCTRDGKKSTCSAINIHHGGMNAANPEDGATWSYGCQTFPPSQWDEFINLVYTKMTSNGMKTIPYVLVTQEEVNKILGK